MEESRTQNGALWNTRDNRGSGWMSVVYDHKLGTIMEKSSNPGKLLFINAAVGYLV